MKIKIKSSQSLKKATSILSAISNGSVIPLLDNLKIEAKSGSELSICATDSKIFCKFYFESENAENNKAFTIPSKKFSEIIGFSNEGETIEIDAVDNKATIRFEKSIYRLACLPVDDFPVFPVIERGAENLGLIIPSSSIAEFKSSVDAVALAVSKNDSRKALLGVLMEADCENKTIGFTGTDGKKLAHSEIKNVTNLQSDIRLICPLPVMQMFSKFIETSDGMINIIWSDNLISFGTDTINIVSPLISASYPNYKNVIPKDCEKVAGVNVKNLVTALSRAAITADEKMYAVILRFADGSEGKLHISSNRHDVGAFETEFDITYAKEETKTSFNIRHLKEVLSYFKDGNIQFDFKSGESPFIIHRLDSMSPMFLLMPIKITDLPRMESEESNEMD